LAAVLLFLPLAAQGPGTPGVAPLNPAFLAWRDNHQAQEAYSLALGPNGLHRLGYRPSPVDRSYLQSSAYPTGGAPLPSSYDLRNVNGQSYLSPIRDQDPFDCCWAFAAMASLESDLLVTSQGASDLSEWYHAYFCYQDFSAALPAFTAKTLGSGLDPIFDQGGSTEQSVALLARGTGAVLEADCPYQNVTDYPQSACPTGHEADHTKLVAAHSFGNMPGAAAGVKAAVMQYGAVAIAIFMDQSATSYDATYASYRYTNTGSGTNHLVDIVGWNDEYPAGQFPSGNQPSANGAWIVRNHWGTGWGDHGYFYISYDTAIYDAWVLLAGPEDYGRIYQYDPLGQCNAYGYSSTTGYFANVFTAQGADTITAVSCYANSANATYQVSVRTGVTTGPGTGTLASGPQSGSWTEPGYRSVALNTPVTLAAGENFSVIVQVTTPGCNYPIPIHGPVTGYSDKATASAGESYVSANGTSWSDLTKQGGMANFNVCLKAFAALPAKSVAGVSPDHGMPGTVVTLTGSGFTGATGVGFGGTAAAAFAVVSDTQATATVPANAATGPVTLAVPSGTLASTGYFTVLCCDVNGDGTVNVADLAPLAANYGKGFLACELDGGATVDDADITLWLNAF
jgi:C1A family cysteine protease